MGGDTVYKEPRSALRNGADLIEADGKATEVVVADDIQSKSIDEGQTLQKQAKSESDDREISSVAGVSKQYTGLDNTRQIVFPLGDIIDTDGRARRPTTSKPEGLQNCSKLRRKLIEIISEKRDNILGLRLKLNEFRTSLRQEVESLSVRDAQLIQRLRVVLDNETSALGPLLGDFEHLQEIRDNLQSRKYDYDRLEDQVAREEYELRELESKLYPISVSAWIGTLADEKLTIFDGRFDRTGSSLSTRNGPAENSSKVNKYLSRKGDMHVLEERLDELRMERAQHVEEEFVRAQVSRASDEYSQAFLLNFDIRHNELQRELAHTKEDVARLRMALLDMEDFIISPDQFDETRRVNMDYLSNVRRQSKSAYMWKSTTSSRLKASKRWLPINFGRTRLDTIADTGSDDNVMSEATATLLGLNIKRIVDSSKTFTLGNGSSLQSSGEVTIDCAFPDEPGVLRSCKFFVFPKLAVPVVMGRAFLKATETLTKFKHRLQRQLSSVTLPLIMHLDNPHSLLRCRAAGEDVLVNADSGSEVDLVSYDYVQKRGLPLERLTSDRQWVQMADGRVVRLRGKVRTYLEMYDDSGVPVKGHQRTFYVLNGLTTDVLFGDDCLDLLDVFTEHAKSFVDVENDIGYTDLNLITWLNRAEKRINRLLGWSNSSEPDILPATGIPNTQGRPQHLSIEMLSDYLTVNRNNTAESQSPLLSEVQFERYLDILDAKELQKQRVAKESINRLPESERPAAEARERLCSQQYDQERARLIGLFNAKLVASLTNRRSR